MLCELMPAKRLLKKITMTIRTYSELQQHSEFIDRFNYLRLGGGVGVSTFGFDRYLNQSFYRSSLWKKVRNDIIVRDNGCDLGVPDYEIHDSILVHHLNPIAVNDLVDYDDWVVNPEFLITTTHQTHNAIHYGDANLLKRPFVERRPGDTKLW